MLGALTALRNHHCSDRIVLLTAPETMAFAAEARVADDIWCDPRLGLWDFRGLRKFRDKLRAQSFAKVYDLDGGTYGTLIFRLLHGWFVGETARASLPWCGDIPGTADYHADDYRQVVHVSDRAARQLSHAGIPSVAATDLMCVACQVTSFKAPFRMDEPFVLVACDPHPGSDGWPLEHWARLGAAIADEGLIPLMTGVKPSSDVSEALTLAAPGTRDIAGHGTLTDLVFLAWASRGAVGCDNGLMHLFAAAGCRSIVLYDSTSDPARTGPRGRDVRILRRGRLADIPVNEVLAGLRAK
jgi:ADP-heptose:LPS heptosyltransferase